jgi:acyl dehydratase
LARNLESEWIEVPQSRIDTFADATDDHQFIHVDPARAAETPIRRNHRPRFLTLSLLSAMNYDCVPTVREQTMGINYGFDKVRFMAPVPAGARMRGRFVLESARFRGAGMIMSTYLGDHRDRGQQETGTHRHLADHLPVRPQGSPRNLAPADRMPASHVSPAHRLRYQARQSLAVSVRKLKA